MVYTTIGLVLAAIGSSVFTNATSILATGLAAGVLSMFAPLATISSSSELALCAWCLSERFWITASVTVLLMAILAGWLPRCLIEALGATAFGSVVATVAALQLAGCAMTNYVLEVLGLRSTAPLTACY